MPRAFAIAGGLSVGTWALAASVVPLPTFEQVVAVVSLVPPLAGMLLGSSLVESMPQPSRLAQRRLATVFGARYVAVHLAAAVITVAMVTSVGTHLYAVVPGFVGLSALCVTALRQWYWVPILPALYGWLQLSQTDGYAELVDVGALGLAVVTVVPGVIYVVGSSRHARP